MTAILTAAEMRALEQAAIASGEVTGLELMERAGRGVVEAILAEWPDIEQGARRAVVLCGPGNNGGDGFVVARLLKERGWEVEVFLYGDAGKLPPDARTNYERWLALGEVEALDDSAAQRFLHDVKDGFTPSTTLWIDAIFGTGLSKPVEDDIGRVLQSIGDGFCSLIAGLPGKVVAVDLPSGIDSESGRPRFKLVQYPGTDDELAGPGALLMPTGEWWDIASHRRGPGGPRYWPLTAKLTVTFQTLKPGHLLSEGPRYAGKVKVVDIGLESGFGTLRPQSSSFVEEAAPDGFGALSKHTGHKYSHGHALLLSGGCGRGGAARLAARGALRIGAGLVTLAVPPTALQENAARLDAIMLHSVKDAGALADLLSDPRLNALAAGPGFGTSDREAVLLGALLDASRATPPEQAEGRAVGAAATPTEAQPSAPDLRPARKPRPVVLDADALTLVARHPDLRARLHDRCVLTPHDGEFARLFPAIAERLHAPATTGLAYSKVDAARDAARESGAVVLLKGPDTVIASPDGRAAINAAVYDRAAPWLATAGSGDVLAGFITGLLARGFAPFDAACTAAWLHVECARSFGPGLIAEDLPEQLPKVFRDLGL